MITDSPGIIYYIIFFAVGAVIFSFLNVVIYRLPNHISFIRGRSFCPSCHKQLRACDMIPVFSWFFLRGRCRNCQSRISFRYPAMEAAGGAAAVLCLLRFGSWNGFWFAVNAEAAIVFLLCCFLAVIAWIDYDTMEIPDSLVVGLILPAVLSAFFFPGTEWIERVIGIFCVSVPMCLLTLLIPGAFGGGDIKLMAVIGFFLGWKMSVTAFFIAVLIGGCYGIFLLATKRKTRKDHFAFGPCLCIGIAAAVFYGEQILGWYLSIIMR